MNVYGFGIHLKWQIESGNHGGSSVAVIASSAEAARTDLIAYFGEQLAKISGPNIMVEGALFNGEMGSPTPPSVPPPVNTDVPYCTGSGVVGMPLSCTMGNWEGEPTSYAYQWLQDGVAIDGGTGPDYMPQTGDKSHSLSCVVTATNAGGSTAAPPSNAISITAIAGKHGHGR